MLEDAGDFRRRKDSVSFGGGQSLEWVQRLTVDALLAILGDGGSMRLFAEMFVRKSCRCKTVAVNNAVAPQRLSIRWFLQSILLQWSSASVVADIHRPMGKL